MKSCRIADPVHGYVDVTAIENAILAAPVAQRLRNVSQNGLAQYVYPEVRSSRFSHSLGVMHLSSAMLNAAMRNSADDVRSALADAIATGIREIDAVADFQAIVGDTAPRDRDALIAHHYVGDEAAAAVEIAEQGLRLAALFHDLGHLPFSHDLEYTLEEYWDELGADEQEASPLKALTTGKREAIHETVGHGLALLLFRSAPHSTMPTRELLSSQLATLAAQVAYRILESPPRTYRVDESAGARAFRWLHTLVASELDADRCDYLLRDGRNYGFEFATYDLARLLGSIQVVMEEDGFRTVVDARATSAAESFVLARFRTYQFSVRHHKVAQVGAALRHVSKKLLLQRADGYLQFIADIGAAGTAVNDHGASIADPAALLDRFSEYDDIWWMNELRSAAREAPHDQWLALVCRRSLGTRSLWKRVELFSSLVAPTSVRDWNLALPIQPEDEVAWRTAVRHLAEENVLVVRHRFRPFATGTNVAEPPLGILAEGTVRPLAEASALVRSLDNAWLDDIQVHAFATSDNGNDGAAVLDRLPLASLGGEE